MAQWPRTARNVMDEIAERIGAPLDPRTVVPTNDIEDSALGMTMREVAAYIAAMNGGNWRISDAGTLFLVPLAASAGDDAPEISAHNAESLSVSDPLEAWSGVRVIWDGDEWNAQDPEFGDETLVVVKRGEQIGFAGDESGRVLTVKVAFGQVATAHPESMWNRGAQVMLAAIQDKAYYPFEARNAALDPAIEIGDAVILPDGVSMICAMSGELDGVCAVDVSAPQDEAASALAGWL